MKLTVVSWSLVDPPRATLERIVHALADTCAAEGVTVLQGETREVEIDDVYRT